MDDSGCFERWEGGVDVGENATRLEDAQVDGRGVLGDEADALGKSGDA